MLLGQVRTHSTTWLPEEEAPLTWAVVLSSSMYRRVCVHGGCGDCCSDSQEAQSVTGVSPLSAKTEAGRLAGRQRKTETGIGKVWTGRGLFPAASGVVSAPTSTGKALVNRSLWGWCLVTWADEPPKSQPPLSFIPCSKETRPDEWEIAHTPLIRLKPK